LLLAGRSASEVERDVDASGRTALHHAAWRGDIRNVELLLDIGCDVNRWSKGLHSYGKTPIFYATTRCRDDVVELLLHHGARTRILNNKGQSVLSLASSHLSEDVVQLVAAAEASEAADVIANQAWAEAAAKRPPHMRPLVHANGWLDFLSSHPDGQVYSDLDPRFCPASESDDITELAVNPTSRESRRLHQHLTGSRSLLWWPPAKKDKGQPAGLREGSALHALDSAKAAAHDEADLNVFHRVVAEFAGMRPADSTNTGGGSSIPNSFWDER